MLDNWFSLLLLLVYPAALAYFQQLPMEYSFKGEEDYKALGTIIVERTVDGNFSGYFVPKADSEELWQGMSEAAKHGYGYSIRTESNKESFKTFNEPCLMLRAGLSHQFRVTLDADQNALLSLSVFPEELFDGGFEYYKCGVEQFPEKHELLGSVVITRVGVLPVPDTESYIQKMEKERQARQHGAQQDNRSWLQKYWMYIVAAFIFVVIMNAATEE